MLMQCSRKFTYLPETDSLTYLSFCWIFCEFGLVT